MSMLAERRRKQKWTVDPRNTAWSNDDSKFGQKMLEKMGWSKGKGLGAQEQGATEHIKVQVKNNHLGLGAAINNEDNWISHQDDFNQLLAELNTCHGQEMRDSSDNKEKKSFSLEEKSKISKNRVHYMKFTKGKDLSSRSKTDLDCIFGKRQSKKTLKEETRSTTPDQNEITTTSTLTIKEYFAKRMAELKNKPQITATDPDLSETQIERKGGKKRNRETKDKSLENSTQPKSKRPKKEKPGEHPKCVARKKGDQAEQELRDHCCDENWESSAEDGEDCTWLPDGQDFTPKSQKRKEKKRLKKQGEAVVNPLPDEPPVKKKKKKKKSSK